MGSGQLSMYCIVLKSGIFDTRFVLGLGCIIRSEQLPYLAYVAAFLQTTFSCKKTKAVTVR